MDSTIIYDWGSCFSSFYYKNKTKTNKKYFTLIGSRVWVHDPKNFIFL